MRKSSLHWRLFVKLKKNNNNNSHHTPLICLIEWKRILFNSLTTLRLVSPMIDFPPKTTFKSYISFSFRVGKLKKCLIKSEVRETILEFNLFKNSPRKASCCNLYRQSKSWGRGKSTTWAFIVKAETLVSIRVETFFLLNTGVMSLIILR